jgi:tetratricopeptide (TPR) repeat protein
MSETASVRYKEALQRGHVAVVRGRPLDAIEQYRAAATLAPERPLPFVRIGEVYLRLHEPREAVKAFDAALERAPLDVVAMEGKAAALAAAGELQAADALRAQAARLEAGPAQGTPRARPGEARLREIEQHVANAAAARAAGDLATAATAYLTAANGYAALGDFEAAIDSCLHGLESRPGNIDIHFLMAVLYLRRGWIELGVQRALLIERRLEIDDDQLRRKALGALAYDFRTRAPALARLAAAPA